MVKLQADGSALAVAICKVRRVVAELERTAESLLGGLKAGKQDITHVMALGRRSQAEVMAQESRVLAEGECLAEQRPSRLPCPRRRRNCNASLPSWTTLRPSVTWRRRSPAKPTLD